MYFILNQRIYNNRVRINMKECYKFIGYQYSVNINKCFKILKIYRQKLLASENSIMNLKNLRNRSTHIKCFM